MQFVLFWCILPLGAFSFFFFVFFTHFVFFDAFVFFWHILALYNAYFLFSIKTEPFKIPEDDGNDLMHTFFNPDKEGWLCKQGGR